MKVRNLLAVDSSDPATSAVAISDSPFVVLSDGGDLAAAWLRSKPRALANKAVSVDPSIKGADLGQKQSDEWVRS